MAVILGLYCLVLAIWLVWALLTSFKNPNDFLGNKYGLPNPWYFDNFAYVIYEYKVEKLIDGVSTVISTGDMILNSVLYSVGSAFVATLVPCITAYLCARYKYKFSKIIYSIVLVCMVIPIVGSQASELQIVIKMGIYDHMFGMWILKSGFLGLYFLVFHEVFLSIPNAYGEAAEIDGASDFCIMTKISLPLAKNTFFTVLLIMFVTYWNDFQTPMLYLPTHPTSPNERQIKKDRDSIRYHKLPKRRLFRHFPRPFGRGTSSTATLAFAKNHQKIRSFRCEAFLRMRNRPHCGLFRQGKRPKLYLPVLRAAFNAV